MAVQLRVEQRQRECITRRDKVRPVSVFDYNEYRKLEDKKDRIALKKELYERKKAADEIRIRQLRGEKPVNDETRQDLVL